MEVRLRWNMIVSLWLQMLMLRIVCLACWFLPIRFVSASHSFLVLPDRLDPINRLGLIMIKMVHSGRKFPGGAQFSTLLRFRRHDWSILGLKCIEFVLLLLKEFLVWTFLGIFIDFGRLLCLQSLLLFVSFLMFFDFHGNATGSRPHAFVDIFKHPGNCILLLKLRLRQRIIRLNDLDLSQWLGSKWALSNLNSRRWLGLNDLDSRRLWLGNRWRPNNLYFSRWIYLDTVSLWCIACWDQIRIEINFYLFVDAWWRFNAFDKFWIVQRFFETTHSLRLERRLLVTPNVFHHSRYCRLFFETG